MSEAIKDQVLTALKKAMPDKLQQINEMLTLFENSEATVYCHDCGLIFYAGTVEKLMEGDKFVDWKMLSFRHVWDLHHKVKVYMPFFKVSAFPLWRLVSRFSSESNMVLNYYEEVEAFRRRLIENNDPRYMLTNDQNWDASSRCYCSTCGKSYYDPKEACLCCPGSKRGLPQEEVETIRVKKR